MISDRSYMPRGKFTAYVCVHVGALQYTTTHLQVLCSSQHLGGKIRTHSNNLNYMLL